jgi:hypothetical protein
VWHSRHLKIVLAAYDSTSHWGGPIVKKFGRAALALVLLCVASTAAAQLSIPAGGSFALGGGSLNLGGTDLQVGGLFSLGGGSVANVVNVVIGAGATLDASSGQITLSGNWSDAGSFLPGNSQVNFIDGSGPSQITGNTSFFNLSFVSATGKNYLFAVGSTQTISGLLTITGAAAAPIQFRSTTAGQVANIDLLAGGAQNISNVGVSNVHATGQHLAPSLSNEGGTGDAIGWFGAAIVSTGGVPADTLSPLGMLLFAFAMFAGVWLTRRHQFKN